MRAMSFTNVLGFMAQLKENNHKEWMDENRSRYLASKAEFELFVQGLLSEWQRSEPDFANLVPKQCVFRINRDIRFSKDKSPYKTHFGAAFNRDGKKSPWASYYMHIEPGGCFLAGGAWAPPAPILKSIRQEIDYDLAGFRAIVEAAPFREAFGELQGERLKTVPAGYSADNEAIAFLRFKSFTVSHSFSDKELTAPSAIKKITRYFETMKPFVDFLNRGRADTAL